MKEIKGGGSLSWLRTKGDGPLYSVDQAKKYSSGFDGGAIYHTNSPELASYYSKVFTDAGVTNFKFVITPTKK